MRNFLTVVIVTGVLVACCYQLLRPERLEAQQLLSKDSEQTAAKSLPISGQVTFLYFNDLKGADAFYGEILGRPAVLDLDWVKIYPLSPTSSVGLVDATHGVLRPSPTKPVLLSLVVETPEQVDQWYSRLKSRGVIITKKPAVNELTSDKGIRAFMFKDPEGYTLEVFAWLNASAPQTQN